MMTCGSHAFIQVDFESALGHVSLEVLTKNVFHYKQNRGRRLRGINIQL